MASINGKSVEGPATTATAGDGSLKTSFMRRFSRLSAKTRSKYRNELRRSTSLLELDSKAKSDEQLTEVDPTTTTTRDKALTNWLGNRLRNKKLEENGKKQDAVIVGDTLLKQKPRLRVRNIGKSNTLGGGIKPADYTSSPMPDHHIITRQSRSATVGGGGQRSHSYNSESTTTATTSQSEMSEMEQVLFRAARLRQRQRGRSASIETRGTDRTSQEIVLYFGEAYLQRLTAMKPFFGMQFRAALPAPLSVQCGDYVHISTIHYRFTCSFP